MHLFLADISKHARVTQKIGPASSQHYNSGGFTGKKNKTTLSQLRALATHTDFGAGRVGQGAWQLDCHKLGSAIFWVTLACLDISSKKRCLYRLFIYHFKAHTISNKLVSKVFAPKKGGEMLWQLQICVTISLVSGVPPPPPPPPTIPQTSEIWTHICGCHNFFPLSSVQIIIIPACCLLCVL